MIYKPSTRSLPLNNRWVAYCAGIFILILSFLLLSGCDSGVISPKGEVAAAELKLSIFSIKLMLIVVIPVIFMACWFGWRYRESNNATYHPEWNHSTLLEIVWWSIPILIISVLGTATWKTTHSLDPYKPIVTGTKPVEIEVVSLDWKWLFIYPESQIATINYLKIPVGTPIHFKITAASPMNSFIIPQLGGQIYAMTGMTTELYLIADAEGNYRGLATNYTGIGFSEMNFKTEVTSAANYNQWVQGMKNSSESLNADLFWKTLVPPSINHPVKSYSSVEKGLFESIVMHYMMPGCTHDRA